MERLPNIITLSRIAGSLGLIFCDVAGVAFWVLYVLCGITDIADGWVARRFHAETKAGSILDSLADLVFVACCCWQIIPILNFPKWLWIWGGAIVTIKLINQICALVMYKKCVFPHTLANKATGLLLFICVPLTLYLESIIPIVIIAVMATFAAVQEGHYIRTKKDIVKKIPKT